MDTVKNVELLLYELLKKRGNPTNLKNEDNDNPAMQELIKEFMTIRDFTRGISGSDVPQSLHKITPQLQQAKENEKNDLSGSEKHAASLKGSERTYRLIAENVDDIVLLVNEGRKMIYCSPSTEKILGHTPEECSKLFSDGQILPSIASAIEKMAEQGRQDAAASLLIEVEEQCKDGTMIWMESLISKAKDEKGKSIGFLCVVRNITQRKLAENDLRQSYERRLKNDFFARLLNGRIELESDVYNHAYRLGIPLPKHFSLYFLQLDYEESFQGKSKVQEEKQKNIDMLIDRLTHQEDSIAWEVPEGIGILSTVHNFSERKEQELKKAEAYIELVTAIAPNVRPCIGIADYFDSLIYVALRFKHAQSAVRIGKGICNKKRVYHFDDCGVYQVLIPFADSDESEVFIKKTLGPLLEYDRKNQTELVDTLEKILSGLSLKEVAEQTFFHYKTIQNRKQRIENILKVSLDSSEVRIMLGTAVRLLKISRCRQLT